MSSLGEQETKQVYHYHKETSKYVLSFFLKRPATELEVDESESVGSLEGKARPSGGTRLLASCATSILRSPPALRSVHCE